MRGVVTAAAAAALVAAQDPWNCSQQPPSAFAPVILTNNVPGMQVAFIPYGATLQSFLVPDVNGTLRDVALGFDDPTAYCAYPIHPYFGAAIGRVANRIANGTFELDGVTYHTPLNENYTHGPGGDTLHGGTTGFDRRVWAVLARNASSVTFGLQSPDGEMGFPGDLSVTIRYTLTDRTPAGGHPAWDVLYQAVTSAPATVVALSQHTYWNLNANVGGEGTVVDHVLAMPSGTAFVEVDDNLIPTGSVPPVSAAPWLDFTSPKPVGRDIANGTVAPGGGYDNAWVWSDWTPGVFQPRVTVFSPLTGIAMEVATDQPSVQFYSGNFLNGSIPRKRSQGGPAGTYQHFGAVVFEAQHLPDSVHNPAFPSVRLEAGQLYKQHTRYTFTSV